MRPRYHLTAADRAGTSPGGALASTEVELNGRALSFNMSGSIPDETYVPAKVSSCVMLKCGSIVTLCLLSESRWRPMKVKRGTQVHLAATSIAFIVM